MAMKSALCLRNSLFLYQSFLNFLVHAVLQSTWYTQIFTSWLLKFSIKYSPTRTPKKLETCLSTSWSSIQGIRVNNDLVTLIQPSDWRGKARRSDTRIKVSCYTSTGRTRQWTRSGTCIYCTWNISRARFVCRYVLVQNCIHTFTCVRRHVITGIMNKFSSEAYPPSPSSHHASKDFKAPACCCR